MGLNQKNGTLMKKVVAYFLIIIFSMALLNAYSSFSFKSFNGSVYKMIKNLVDIYSITLHVDKLNQSADEYAHSGAEKYLNEYELRLKALLNLTEKVKKSSKGDEYYNLIDLQNMIDTYDQKSRKIFKDYNSKKQQVYIDGFLVELGVLKGDINNEAKDIMMQRLNPIMEYYEKFFDEIAKRERLIYILTGLLSLACVFFAFRFSRSISAPIHQLVIRLKKVAKGQFDTDNIDIKTNDEINVLIESFNFMIMKIRNQIEEIKTKADIEKELKEQQIKNLEMRNLLNQSELLYLQSQINPHFLYNTMNIIVALASIENADKTKKMIECLSDMLKYNVRRINENVPLREEYKIIEDYLYIQKARFGTRIEYKLNYEEGLMHYYVPSMILQPFIENAIIHGLEPKESDGLLEVNIADDGDNILIMIRDNGMGMEEDKLIQVSSYDENDRTSLRGVGISNVVRRLEIAYGKNVVSIKSVVEHGTEVNIKLPKDINSKS